MRQHTTPPILPEGDHGKANHLRATTCHRSAASQTGKAKAVRFETMDAICRELKCQPGDLLEYVEDDDPWKR